MQDINIEKIPEAINTKMDLDSSNANPAICTTANLVYNSANNELNIVTDVGHVTP